MNGRRRGEEARQTRPQPRADDQRGYSPSDHSGTSGVLLVVPRQPHYTFCDNIGNCPEQYRTFTYCAGSPDHTSNWDTAKPIL